MALNTMRHDPIFDHTEFFLPINVIGVGGVGSSVVKELVRLGCGTFNIIRVWDHDTVENHNLSNQEYGPEDVGKEKTFALFEQMKKKSGVSIERYGKFVPNEYDIPGVVFSCVDDMQVRKQLWEVSSKGSHEVPLFIDTRTDGVDVVVYALSPREERHQKIWERHWHPDEQNTNQTAGCGSHIAVGPTASIAAAFAVWQLISWWTRYSKDSKSPLFGQVIVPMRSLDRMKTYYPC